MGRWHRLKELENWNWLVTACHALHAWLVTDGNRRAKLHFSQPPIPKEAAVKMSGGDSAADAGVVVFVRLRFSFFVTTVVM